MDFVGKLFFYAGIFSLLLLVGGLFKPWMFVWWEDVQNRRRVVMLYAPMSFLFLTIYFIISHLI